MMRIWLKIWGASCTIGVHITLSGIMCSLFVNSMLCWQKLKRVKISQKRHNMFYKLGKNKFMEELDCISLIELIRELKVIKKMVLTENQIFLNRFSKNNILSWSPKIKEFGKHSIESKLTKLPSIITRQDSLEMANYNKKVEQLTNKLAFEHWTDTDKWMIKKVISDIADKNKL